jgi:hypothetical protein
MLPDISGIITLNGNKAIQSDDDTYNAMYSLNRVLLIASLEALTHFGWRCLCFALEIACLTPHFTLNTDNH